MSTFALDSSAILAWILQEQGRWRVLDRALGSESADPVLPAPALTEVITLARRRGNTSAPLQIVAALKAKGIRFELLTESDLVRAAELLELSQQNPAIHSSTGTAGTLSLGDALILAVVERLGVQVITRDRAWTTFAASGHTSAKIIEI